MARSRFVFLPLFLVPPPVFLSHVFLDLIPIPSLVLVRPGLVPRSRRPWAAPRPSPGGVVDDRAQGKGRPPGRSTSGERTMLRGSAVYSSSSSPWKNRQPESCSLAADSRYASKTGSPSGPTTRSEARTRCPFLPTGSSTFSPRLGLAEREALRETARGPLEVFLEVEITGHLDRERLGRAHRVRIHAESLAARASSGSSNR